MTGYHDVVMYLRGSAITGRGFRQKSLFDGACPADFDLAFVSPTMFQRALEIGVVLRANGTRTAPLNEQQLKKLGLTSLKFNLTHLMARKVSLMLYRSRADVEIRGSCMDIS